MTPRCSQPQFDDEAQARRFLENLLAAWFLLKPEVLLSYQGDDAQRYLDGWHAGVERVGGLFRVGLIYLRHTGRPQFCMSAERQWDADNGPIAHPIHTRTLVGNGTRRRPAAPEGVGA